MSSERDSYQTCEIWGRSVHVKSSYNSLFFHGEASKFAMSPRQQWLMKTHKFHNIASPRSKGFSDQIWHGSVQPARRSTWKCKTCHFLLPVGGAMTMIEYWHIDVFRAGLLSYMKNLGQIGQCTFELEQLPVSWRIIEIRRVVTAKAFSENSQFIQLFITKVFRWHRPNLKSLGSNL